MSEGQDKTISPLREACCFKNKLISDLEDGHEIKDVLLSEKEKRIEALEAKLKTEQHCHKLANTMRFQQQDRDAATISSLRELVREAGEVIEVVAEWAKDMSADDLSHEDFSHVKRAVVLKEKLMCQAGTEIKDGSVSPRSEAIQVKDGEEA